KIKKKLKENKMFNLFSFVKNFVTRVNVMCDYVVDKKIEENPKISPKVENLNIKYNTQRDNKINPGGAFNVTCLHMCLDYLGYSKYSDDELFQMANNKDTNDAMLKIYGKNEKWVN